MEMPPIRNTVLPAKQVAPAEASLVEIADDDDILEIIYVDQIVMEHNRSTCTPQRSVSRYPPVAPSVDRFASKREEEPCFPPELRFNCRHGVKLGRCPEVSTHVEEMKDDLLALSHELLDDATGLWPDHVEQLHQERVLVNKQIQQLEILIQDKERKKFLFVASTPTHSFQHQTTNRKANNKRVFGNHSFRPNQREIINATISGCDVFVLMPAGVGKSLTYQVNRSKAVSLLSGGQAITMRFPLAVKVLKQTTLKPRATQAKVPLKQTTLPMADAPPTRFTMGTKEELLDINGLGKAKVSTYGDRLLETIESTINEHCKTVSPPTCCDISMSCHHVVATQQTEEEERK